MTELMTADQQMEIYSNPMQVLGIAIRQGADPSSLTTLSTLVMQWKDRLLKEAFGNAVAEFQQICPPIVKRKQVLKKDGGRLYDYASYEDVWDIVGPILGERKIAVSFACPSGANDKQYQCVVTLRVGGYSEAYPFVAPMPNLAAMAGAAHLTEPQAFGVVLSYYKRYALCAALNIVVVGEDSDAAIKAMQPSGITEDMATELELLLTKRTVKWDKFFEWASEREHQTITELKDISLETYKVAKQDALNYLAAKDTAKKGAK